LIAAEQQRPDVAERRVNFTIARRFVEPGQLVFLDESGAKTNMTRLYGRASVGERCIDHTPPGHWQTMTMISAIRLEGVVHDATLLIDGPMNRDTFEMYTEQCLAPALRPGDVVIMDNLSSHKGAAVRGLIENVQADLWYLPPYSPDLNPIEKLWSKVKAWLRRVMVSTFGELLDAMAAALRAVEPEECVNYFRSLWIRPEMMRTALTDQLTQSRAQVSRAVLDRFREAIARLILAAEFRQLFTRLEPHRAQMPAPYAIVDH
jgi:transposase